MIEKIKEILMNHVEVPMDEIKAETNLKEDLGLNSLDVVNLMVAFEDEFNIEISDRDIKDLMTVGDIAEYLEQLV